ncbi:MAG: aldo/keto reductase, partial [Pseudonocardiales bacterium]
QGMLTSKYLDGVPAESRMARDSSLSPDLLTEQNRTHIQALNALAGERGQTLAQLALAWALRDERMTSLVVGASSVAQLEDSLTALQRLDFTDEELADIDRHAVDGGIDLWRSSSSS